MTNFKKWEIVLVPFPFTDLTSTKRRPAIVVSPDIYNQNKDVVIAFVTSQINTTSRFGDYKLQKWKEAGMLSVSLVRMKFATIDKSLIIKILGVLEKEDSEELEKNIVDFFKS